MLKFIKNFWKEIFSLTKTWSIRKQMLSCYLISMMLIIILIFILVLLNIYILKYQTVDQIDTTLDDQANQNIHSLIRQTSVYMHSKVTEVTSMFGLIQEMLLNVYETEKFSLNYLASYTSSEIPEEYWVDEMGQRICTNYSSYKAFNENPDQTFLDKISVLDNIWPSIFKLTTDVVLRYYLYFPNQGILKNFPGIELPGSYMPSETEWYRCFEDNNRTMGATTEYKDELGTGLNIVTLSYPLYDLNNTYIGLVAADLVLDYGSYLFSQVLELSYLKTGFTSLIYKNGSIINTTNPFWNPYKTIQEINEILWQNISTDFNNTHFFIFKGDIYRACSFPVSMNFSLDLNGAIENWYYLLILVVKESDIMEYRDNSKNDIENIGILLLIITSVCSAVTIAVVTVLIYYLAKSITDPLKGVIEFSNKINSKATEKDMITLEELNSLKEGEDQVAELVRTYKELAGSLVTKKDDKIPKPLQISQNRVFPRNELYLKNKLEWKSLIDSLPN